MSIEKILRIEVTHFPYSEWGEPAHIRVTGYTEQGPFTIRRITGLSTARIIKKIDAIREVFLRLQGTDVKVMERKFSRGEFREPVTHRIIVPATLPKWAKGDWEDIIQNHQT
jgi:hypothetical protein